MRLCKICLLFLPAILIASSAVTAQSTSGTLRGTVTSHATGPMQGVIVTATGAALQGEMNTQTDARGHFFFPALPAGIYSLALRRLGYTPLRITDVAIHLNATSSIEDVTLTPQAVQLNEITISGARAVVDFSTTAAAITFDSARFRALPTNRDYTSLLALTPQGSPSPYSDGTSFGGATGYDNKYFIDGIHASNPLSSDGSIRLPYNFIQQVQVVTGGYEAEFGRSQGAVVNVVTNSGGNELHGEAVAFFTANQLRAAPRWGIAERPVDNFSHYDIGLSLGGPIKRDRLWFYTAYNPLFENKDVTFTGVPADHDRLVRHLFAGKLTWRPREATDVTLTILGDPTSRDAVEGAEAWTAPLSKVTDPRVVLGAYRDGGWATALHWRQQAWRRLLLTGAVSHLTNVHQVAARNVTEDPVSLARVDDYQLNESSRNFGRAYRVNTARSSVEAAMTYLGNLHTIKVGANYEYNAVHLPFFVESFVRHQPDGSWTWFTSHWEGRGHSAVPAVYTQDSWEITNRLRANFGLRWEGQFIDGNVGRGLSIADEFSPRIGMIFQPGVLGSQKVFGFVGRFYEQLPLWPVTALTMPFGIISGTYPQNPLVSRSRGEEFAVDLGSIAAPDRKLKGQHYDELSLGYERRINTLHRVEVRGTSRVLRQALESGAATVDPQDPSYGILGLLGNPGSGALAQVPRGTRRYTGFEFVFERSRGERLNYLASYVLSRSFGNLPGEFDSDSRVPATHTQGQTWDPHWWDHATGYLPSDRRHLVKLSGSYRLLDNLSAGVVSWFGTGLPLSEFEVSELGTIAHARKRGTAGRTPSVWSTDLRLTYDAPEAGRWRPRVTLDVFNLGNQRRAVDFDQLHYLDATHVNENPNYLKVNRYQAPLNARLGVVIGY